MVTGSANSFSLPKHGKIIRRHDGKRSAFVSDPGRPQNKLYRPPHSKLPTCVLEQPSCGCHARLPTDVEERRIQATLRMKQQNLLQFQVATKERLKSVKNYRRVEDGIKSLSQGAYHQQLLRGAKHAFQPYCEKSIGRRDLMQPIRSLEIPLHPSNAVPRGASLDRLQTRIKDINKKLLNVMDRLTNPGNPGKPVVAVYPGVSELPSTWESESNISLPSSNSSRSKDSAGEEKEAVDYPLNIHVQHAVDLQPSRVALHAEKSRQDSLKLFRQMLSQDARRRARHFLAMKEQGEGDRSGNVTERNATCHEDLIVDEQTDTTCSSSCTAPESPAFIGNSPNVGSPPGECAEEPEYANKTTADSSSQTDANWILPENSVRKKEPKVIAEEEILTVCLQFTKGKVMLKYI